ncbi:hypothetical protein V6N12_002978 [Hibiscus sabdariffa]|uniref:RNase H type-1 domain-containing protein n=1 Tax=Hibiscus sabdariffa TaxID=183260 RepID=A0ABR2EAJ6_9ROSI
MFGLSWDITSFLMRCFHHVILEGDFKVVLTKLILDKEDFLEINTLIWDAKQLSLIFTSSRYHFTSQEGNKVAHAMAQEGAFSSDSIWIVEAPTGVEALATEDRRWIVPT